jgi:hypothetical protein
VTVGLPPDHEVILSPGKNKTEFLNQDLPTKLGYFVIKTNYFY